MPPNVLVISGISGSGKSTLGEMLRQLLVERGRHAVVLDGDSMRQFFDGALLYSAEDRLMVSKILVYAASLLSEQGVGVILATMLSQPGAREFLEQGVPFIEVHLDVSIETCRNHDVKSVYEHNEKKETPQLVGMDLAFARPADPDLTIQTHTESPTESLDRMVAFLAEKGCFGLNEEPE